MCPNHVLSHFTGLPFYGQGYAGATGMNQPHEGIDDVHWHASTDGTVPYYEIYPHLQDESLTTVRDDVTKTEYGYFDEEGGVVSFDDERSICDKMEYGILNRLNGFFIW